VEDNGIGMSENVRKRTFEPFFTTKEIGQGTGLGLSVSYFIITNNHKGQMEVQSTRGQGTCFTLRLPLASSQPLVQEPLPLEN
jgi:signal transduction histidine kinase